MKENYKDIEISGRKFRIKKFDAKTGSFMLFKVTGLLAPLFKSINIGKLKEAKSVTDVDAGALNITGILSELGNLSEKDFNYIQDKCLQVCGEVLPAGIAPVINENGSFGVQGLEEDTMTVLALTAHAIMFNVKGFFIGSPLASIVEGFMNTSPRN